MARESLLRKVTGRLLGFLAVFCQINIQEHNEIKMFKKEHEKTVNESESENPETPRYPEAAAGGAPLWCKLTVCFYIYLNIRLCSVMYWQYQYDYEYSKLKQIDAKLAKLNQTITCEPDILDCSSSSDIQRRVAEEMKEFHHMQFRHSRAWLESLGQPIAELHWAASAGMSILLWVTFIMYLSYPICTNLKLMEPLNLYFIRVMHSVRYETIQCEQLVRDCAKRLLDSSRNFVLNEIHKSEEIVEIVTSPVLSANTRLVGQVESARHKLEELSNEQELGVESQMSKTSVGPIKSDSRLSSQYRNHLLAYNHLTELVEGGHLLPINRSEKWVDRMCMQFTLMCIVNFIYSFVFDSALLYWWPAYLGHFRLGSLADLLTYLELWAVMVISVFAITLFVILLNVITTDQMRYIDWLDMRMSKCVEANDRLFCQNLKRSLALEVSNECLILINKNLMRVYMEYEMFQAQFKPVQATFSFISKGTALIALSSPILCRAQMMYLEGAHRSVGIYYCATAVIFTDSLIIPLTRINSRSKILYERMMSLLSQAIEFDVMTAHPRPSRGQERGHSPRVTIDRHLIWRMRNILLDSKKFTQQFAAQVLPGIPVIVPNMIRLHYWYVLVILSYYCKLDSWKTILGDLQDDPLHLLGDL